MEYKDAWLIGVEAWKEGDLEKASQAFEYACRGDKVACPDYVLESYDPELMIQRGLTFLKFHAFVEARDCFQHVVDESPDHIQALTQLGICYLRLREGDAALPPLNRVLELEPENATVLQWLANALVMVGEYERALVAAESCLKLNPASVSAKVMRAQAYEKLERWPEALSDYRVILEAVPGNTQFQELLARTLCSAVEHCEEPEALLDYCQQLRETGGKPEGVLQLREAKAYRLLGDFSKATESLEKARKAYVPGDDVEKAELLFCQGREGEALEVLRAGEKERFVRGKLLVWDRDKISGWSGSPEDLEQLLSGVVEIRDSAECLVESVVQLGGGWKRCALLSVNNTGLEIKTVLQQRYKEPPVPLGDLSQRDWTEGQLREGLSGSMPPCHGDPGLPPALGLEESWAQAYKVLVTLASVRTGVSMDIVPEFQHDLARRLVESDRWTGEELREAREALCASWLNKAGTKFVFESLDTLSGSVGELTCQAARVAVARLGAEEYQKAEQSAERLLRGRVSLRLRCALAYCFPTQPSWTEAALEAWFASAELNHDGWKLLANVSDPAIVHRMAVEKEAGPVASRHFESLLRLGASAGHLLLVLFDLLDAGTDLAQVIARIDSPPVREFFSRKTEDSTIGEVAKEYCQALGVQPKSDSPGQVEDSVLKAAEVEDGVLRVSGTSQRVSSLEGISSLGELRELCLANCAPLGLAALAGLKSLEVLELHDPENDPAWQLVDLNCLLKLSQLRSIELPGSAQGHPVYQRLLTVTSKRSAPEAKGDRVNLFRHSPERLQEVISELGEQIKTSFGRNLMQCGLDEVAIEGVSLSWVAVAIYSNAPEEYQQAFSLLPERMVDELVDLAEWLEESREDGDDWSAAIDWTGISFGGAYIEFASNNLYQVERAFRALLKGEQRSVAVSDWDVRNGRFEEKLKALGTFESEPHLDLDRGYLTWTEDKQPGARCPIQLLGVHSGQEFIAGWADEIASMVVLGEPILGLPALAQCSPKEASKLVHEIASFGEGLLAVKEFVRPEGVIYVGLREPGGCSAAGKWDNNNQPNVEDRELFQLLTVVLETLRPDGSDEVVAKGLEILHNTIVEIRRRARLYWYGTRAENYFLELAAKLQASAKQPKRDLYLAVRANLDEWRIRMEQWKPDPIRYR